MAGIGNYRIMFDFANFEIDLGIETKHDFKRKNLCRSIVCSKPIRF